MGGWGSKSLPVWLSLTERRSLTVSMEPFGTQWYKFENSNQVISRVLPSLGSCDCEQILLAYQIASSKSLSTISGDVYLSKTHNGSGPPHHVKCLDLQSVSTINKWGWACELFVSKLDWKFTAIAKVLACSFTLNYWTELFHFVPLCLVKWKYCQRGNATIFDKEIICSGLERPVSNLSIWPTIANTNKILRSSGAH